jgi:multiple sugar transport system permease protein
MSTLVNNSKKYHAKPKLSDNIKALFFLVPSWVLLLIFFITPMVLTVYFAFTNLALTGTAAQSTEFIGLENFVQMFNDPRFRASVIRTITFLFFSAIVGQCFLGFMIAFLLRGKRTIVKRVVGIAVIAAWVTPEIVAGFNIVTFLAEGGTLNAILGFVGIDPVAWTWEFPMFSVIMANIWRGTAFSMMVFQAALDDIPKEVEEAAAMDGATNGGIIRHVTIPMVRGTIGTNMMLVTLQTLGVFALIFTMTGGGPGDATMTLPIFMYRQAFVSFQLGYGTAISLILLVIGVVFSLTYMKALKMET